MLTALVDLSLRYKVLVLVAFVMVVVFGVRAFQLVPVDAFPMQVNPANQLFMSDSLVARSAGAGMTVVSVGGITRLVNLTVADNTGEHGVAFFRQAGIVSLANSIVVGSDTSLAGTTDPIAQVANLLSGDPKFVKRNQGNYRLKNGSPAVDKGKKKPPGKLGPSDLDETARVKGGKVDIGAYESF